MRNWDTRDETARIAAASGKGLGDVRRVCQKLDIRVNGTFWPSIVQITDMVCHGLNDASSGRSVAEYWLKFSNHLLRAWEKGGHSPTQTSGATGALSSEYFPECSYSTS